MGRSPCCDKNGLKKGPWTPEEDQRLTDYIQLHGPGNWRNLPKNAGLKRCGKSCRLRWTNYLRPDIKRGRFSFEEEETIIQLHSILGNKWSAIAARLPGRTDNEIKNYWNTHIRKRLLRMGVDPVTHSPRFDLMEYLSSVMGPPLSGYNNLNAQLNLSSLMGLQALLNPELIRLLSALTSSLSVSNEANNQLLNAQLLTMLHQNQNLNQNQFVDCSQFQPEMQQPQDFGLNSNSTNVSGQTTPENSSSPSRNTLYPPNMEQWDAMNSSLEQLINSPSNEQQRVMGISTATPLSNSSNVDLLKFDIPLGSLDLSEFL
ncbi:hypothetical protein V2J09_010828 [Rumex salicifolius]